MSSILANGFIVRLICMALVMVMPIKNADIKILLLFLTDWIDCAGMRALSSAANGGPLNPFSYRYNGLCKTFNYQIIDKIIDLLTYALVQHSFAINPLFNYMIIYRAIGVALFAITHNDHWLILFPDLYKEVWAYDRFISKITLKSFAVIFVLKAIFEYIWHTYVNPHLY